MLDNNEKMLFTVSLVSCRLLENPKTLYLIIITSLLLLPLILLNKEQGYVEFERHTLLNHDFRKKK